MPDKLNFQALEPQSVSIVLPVYGNAEMLEELTHRLISVLRPITDDLELIFVNDASPDDSRAILELMAISYQRIIVLSLLDNIGQQNAIRLGLKRAQGDAIVVMDADLQDPPEAIPELLTHLTSGAYEAVFAGRVGQYQSLYRMICSWVFRWILRLFTRLPKGAGSFVIMTREMSLRLLMRETSRFYLPGGIGNTGLPIAAIPVRRNERPCGRSTYSSLMRIGTALSHFRSVFSDRMNQGPAE